MPKELLEFDELKADITVYVGPTLSIQVNSFATSAAAIDAGKKVKSLRDRIEKKRKELVGPLNDQVKRINEYAKTLAEPLLGAEDHLKAQLLAFEKEQAKIRAAEQARLEQERQAALRQVEEEAHEIKEAASFFGASQEEAEQSVEAHKSVVDGEFQGRAWDINDRRIKNTRKTWKFLVQNKAMLPQEFLIPDEKAIRAALVAGRTDIPGVRAWQEETLSFGSKTSVSRQAITSEEEAG